MCGDEEVAKLVCDGEPPSLTRSAPGDKDRTLGLEFVRHQRGLKPIGVQVADARDVELLAELLDGNWDREARL
jgi:hypothetical protein